MEENLSDLVSEETFWNWLKPRVTPEQLSEMFRYACMLKGFFPPGYAFSKIFEEMLSTSATRIRQIINQNDNFRIKCSDYDKQFISSLLDYMEFFLIENKSICVMEDNPKQPEKFYEDNENEKKVDENESKGNIVTNNKPSKQPPWSLDESIILLDACIQAHEHPENRQQIIRETSSFLRNMAIKQNVEIDSQYRNENGIHFQMMSMESALAGKTIIKPATKRFLETVDFYLTQPEAFQEKLQQIRTLYATDEQKTEEGIEKSCVMIDDKSRDTSENEEKDVPAPFSFHNVEDQFPSTQRNNKPEPLPLYIIYQLDLSYLENKALSEIPEMEKLWRALGRNQILDLFSLLRLTREDIDNLKQFGQKKQQLLYQQLKVFSSVRTKRDEESKKSFLSSTNTNEIVKITINPNEEFDQEFIEQVHNNKEYVAEILTSIIDEVIKIQEKPNITKTIKNLLKDLPEKRANSKVLGFIQIFPINNDQKIKMLSLLSDDDCTISDFTGQCLLSETFELTVLKKFLLFCSFDITEEISHLEDDLGLKMRWYEILSKKSAGETLQQIGDDLSVTRERIRQIDTDIKNRFVLWNYQHNILGKVYACRGCDKTITEKELSEHFGDKTSILIYLLKNSRDNVFTYDPQTKAFIFGDSDIPGLVQKAVDDLPQIIHEKQLSNIIDRISAQLNAETELISLCIKGTYKKTGDVYHKTRLKKKNVYKFILGKYYSEGMAVYDEEEVERFRAYVLAEFGDIGLPDNNRAISARLAAVGILCGRGIYMPKRDEYIPLELANRIYEYIITSDHDVFLMNTLFSVFETELRQSGVDNKYYLQGILHELYSDKLFFSRDYVSKNSKITNIYDSVIKYIQKSKLPVSTQQIQSAFPGITPIVMSLATDHPDIIKLYGEFLHRKNLPLKAGDEEFLLNLLHTELNDQKEHHSKDLFEIAQNKRLDILNHLGIFSSYNFFSLLECLFGEEFQFERPYIANNGVEIGRATERIQAMIEDSDEILISEIRDFAVANHLPFFNYFDFINSQNKTHLMKNKNTLIRIEKTGIDDSIARNIESEIFDEAVITMLIRELTCVPIFPRINVPWNEWLIYSVLKKWSTLLEVSTTNVKYKDAIPVVARKNKLSLDSINTDNIEDDDVSFTSVDVDNIDELLEPFIHLYLNDEADDEF